MYFIFVFNDYYPKGGMEDFHSSYDNLEDAMKKAKSLKLEYANYTNYLEGFENIQVWNISTRNLEYEWQKRNEEE